jgi:hypothetical protein
LPVESSTEISGIAVHGMSDLKQLMRQNHAADFARSFSKAMLSFAWGRPLNYHDDEQLERVTGHFRQHDHRLDELVKAIVRQKLADGRPLHLDTKRQSP